MDINDPANPYGRVNRVEIEATIHYVGEGAWNQNVLLPRLETFLRQYGYDLRGYRPAKYWDKQENEIDEQEFKDYIYARHGHIHGGCSSCPDPVKWKEAERVARKANAEDDMFAKSRRKKKKQKTKVIYIMETEEERALRQKMEKEEIKVEQFELVKGGGHRVEEF